jgi:hypothetical protein
MHDPIVRFSISLVDNRHKVEPDLEPDELEVIGYVTVQWAHLEHEILISTLQLSNGAPPPKDATCLSFERRLGAWRQTIERFVTDAKEKARLLRLHSEAARRSAQTRSWRLDLGHHRPAEAESVQLPALRWL